jgi:hypothetical protein
MRWRNVRKNLIDGEDKGFVLRGRDRENKREERGSERESYEADVHTDMIDQCTFYRRIG